MKIMLIHKNNIISRLRRNFIILVSGNGLASLLGFAALALNARALGPELLGIMALLQSFVVVVSSFFSFDTWQPVIKFGAEAQSSKNDERLRDIVMLGFIYDLIGAFSATAVGLMIVIFGLPLLGIKPEFQVFAGIYCIVIIFSSYSAAKGVLRLFDRFDLLAIIQIAMSAVGLLAAGLLWYFEASFSIYIYSYAGLGVIQSVAIFAVVIVLWRSKCLPSLTSPRFDDHVLRKSFMRFSWATGGLSTLNVMRQHADAFFLAALLGPAATGIYKVASQIASLVSRLGDPLQQVIFPEMAALVAKKEYARLRRILVAAFIFGFFVLVIIVFGAALFGPILVGIVGGAAYASASIPLLLLVFSQGLSVTGFYIRPTVVTLIGPEVYLFNTFIPTLIFFPVLYFSVNAFGISGAGISQAVFTVVWFFLNILALNRCLSFQRNDFIGALSSVRHRLRF